MKKLFLLLLLGTTYVSFSQEFSTDLYFEDALGNKDTLTVGYDKSATDSVDSDLGEVNIIKEAWDSTFDVRITNELQRRGQNVSKKGTYHLKEQIIRESCNEPFFDIMAIDIKCNNWPVTASWNKQSFNTNCLNGSILTSFPPGGWWDVGSDSNLGRIELSQFNKITFTENHHVDEDGRMQGDGYFFEDKDTISVFWLFFADSSFLETSTDITSDEDVSIFPNPFNDNIQVYLPDFNEQNVSIRIFDSLGNLIYTSESLNWNSNFFLDTGNFSSGVYIIEISSHNRKYLNKIIKL